MEKIIDDLTDSEWAMYLGFNFENPLAKEFRRIVNDKFYTSENKNINRLFQHSSSVPEGGYDRKITDIIYTVPYRGFRPTAISEGNKFKPLTFDIASASELKMSNIVKSSPAVLRDCADAAADRMIREKESNMIYLLSLAAREDGNVISCKDMSIQCLTSGYANFVKKNSHAPNAIIMNASNVFKLASENKKGNWSFDVCRGVSFFHGSDIIQTDCIGESEVLLCDGEVGNYISYPVCVSIHPAARRMVSEVVCSMECAMFCRSEKVHMMQVGE